MIVANASLDKPEESFPVRSCEDVLNSRPVLTGEFSPADGYTLTSAQQSWFS